MLDSYGCWVETIVWSEMHLLYEEKFGISGEAELKVTDSFAQLNCMCRTVKILSLL